MLTAKASSGTTTYSYDANGNRIEQNSPTGGMTFYSWDPINRMTQANPVTGPVTLSYNADGNRVEKLTASQTRKFIYDFENVLQETDGNLFTTKEYTSTGEEYGELISSYENGRDLYFETDALGSTDALLTDNEFAQDRYSYRAFGLATHTGTPQCGSFLLHGPLPAPLGSVGTATSAGSEYNYVGRQGYFQDVETGLYFVRKNYYDYTTGRWIGEDKGGYNASTNLYRYCRNNPVNVTDPSGLECSCEGEKSIENGPVQPYDWSKEAEKWNRFRHPAEAQYDWSREAERWQGYRHPAYALYLDDWKATDFWQMAAFLGKPPSCGTDVSGHIYQVMVQTQLAFNALSVEKKLGVCDGLADPTSGWDIEEFYDVGKGRGNPFKAGQCGSRKCQGTVTIGGHCYWAAEANYLLWGHYNHMCQNFYEEYPSGRGSDSLFQGGRQGLHYNIKGTDGTIYKRNQITLEGILSLSKLWRVVFYGIVQGRDLGLGLDEDLKFKRSDAGSNWREREPWIEAGWYSLPTLASSTNIDAMCAPCGKQHAGVLTVHLGSAYYGDRIKLKVTATGLGPPVPSGSWFTRDPRR